MCGHSLGLAPVDARSAVEQELADWEQLGVLGHEHARVPWIGYAESLAPLLAPLVGADSDEVVAMNSLSVNLQLLLASFYRPSGARRTILIEAGAFSSDRHCVESQLRWHGLDPQVDLVEIAPRPGADLLHPEDVEAVIQRLGERLALILWPGVQYRTGQTFDVARVARAAHAVGALAGFDLAHAVGNVPLDLHASAADFAVWCSYKYLNGGPGALAGAFVHRRHLQQQPQLCGWWGHEGATRFAMGPQFVAAAGAARYALSNPPILSAAPLLASLPMFTEAGMRSLHQRATQLGTGFIQALRAVAGDRVTLVTPEDALQRGAQLSWRLQAGTLPDSSSGHLLARLLQQGLVADWRQPDILRLSLAPLYNNEADIAHSVDILDKCLRN